MTCADTQQINSGMAKGAAWMILLRLTLRAIGLLSTIILARLLAPSDFGLVAMATMILAATEVLSEFNFDVVLIYNQQAGQAAYDTVWTLSAIRGLIVAAVLAIIADPIAMFMADGRVEAIVYTLGIVSVVEGFQNVGIIDFRKKLQFAKDFAFMFWAKLVATIFTITAAAVYHSYWALVAGVVVERLTRVLMSYILHPYRPRFALSEWRAIVCFSKWLLVGNILNFIYARIDTFVVGKIAGVQALGLYSVAYEISNLATTELIAPIRRAVFPGYARMAEDRTLLRVGFTNVWALTLAAAVPVALGIGLVADPLVRVMLGEQWIESIGLIQILSIHGLSSIAGSNIAPLFLALGHPRMLANFAALGSMIIVPLLLLATSAAGISGAVWAVTVTSVLLLFCRIILAVRALELPLVDIVRCSWRTIAAAVGMAVGVLAARSCYPPDQGVEWHLIELLVSSLVGGAVYIGVHFGLWRLCGSPRGVEAQMLQVLRTATKRLVPLSHR